MYFFCRQNSVDRICLNFNCPTLLLWVMEQELISKWQLFQKQVNPPPAEVHSPLEWIYLCRQRCKLFNVSKIPNLDLCLGLNTLNVVSFTSSSSLIELCNNCLFQTFVSIQLHWALVGVEPLYIERSGFLFRNMGGL